MSLRRLVLGTLLGAFPGPVRPDWVRGLTTSGIAGFVLFGGNIVDMDQVNALTTSIHADRADVLIAIDEEGGDVTRLGHRSGSPYPGNGALGVVDDPVLTRAVYASIGADLARVGIDLDLAPTVDVNSTSDNPVIGTRSFGADPELVARHALAAVDGLQSAGVAACAKHFPGHGATTVDSHLALPTVTASPALLGERDLPPFVAAVNAGARAIMTAHIRIPELTGEAPATFSPAAIALLRDELGYPNVIVTDALEMQGAAAFARARTGDMDGVAAGAVLALRAGADLLCIGAEMTEELVERIVASVIAAIDAGRLSKERLERANTRVAGLAAWVGANRLSRVNGVASNDLGLQVARRAVSVEGTLPDLSHALVIQLEADTTIAEGRVPWGVLPHLNAHTSVIRLNAGEASASGIAHAAAGRPIVVTGRNLHRLKGAVPLIEELASTNDIVVVEMGWPSRWRPQHAKAFVTTYGATRANSRAAAETLGLAGSGR